MTVLSRATALSILTKKPLTEWLPVPINTTMWLEKCTSGSGGFGVT